MATTGMIDSGRAVPTAANILPTAPSDKPSLAPNHSTLLVNNSAPSKMIINPSKSSINTCAAHHLNINMTLLNIYLYLGKGDKEQNRPKAISIIFMLVSNRCIN